MDEYNYNKEYLDLRKTLKILKLTESDKIVEIDTMSKLLDANYESGFSFDIVKNFLEKVKD